MHEIEPSLSKFRADLLDEEYVAGVAEGMNLSPEITTIILNAISEILNSAVILPEAHRRLQATADIASVLTEIMEDTRPYLRDYL